MLRVKKSTYLPSTSTNRIKDFVVCVVFTGASVLHIVTPTIRLTSHAIEVPSPCNNVLALVVDYEQLDSITNRDKELKKRLRGIKEFILR